ncbi:hypothetical protein HED60_19195 [Planctomycetales bacterium ZRK34]|nr:hypothetical protein HED60_19195 [Planctomycetales bacterium ZRK34]
MQWAWEGSNQSGLKPAETDCYADSDGGVGAPDGAHSDENAPYLAQIHAALNTLDEADRAAIAEHVEALAKLSPAKRAAILTLTGE